MFHKYTIKQTFENSKLCDAEFADPCAPPSLLAWLSIQSPCRSADNKFHSRISACDSRPLVTWCLWQMEYHVCFGSVSTPNNLAAVLPLGTRAFLPHPSTDSDRCAVTTTIRDQRTIRKLTLTPLVFLTVWWSRGVSFPVIANSPLALWHEGIEPDLAGFLIQQQQYANFWNLKVFDIVEE